MKSNRKPLMNLSNLSKFVILTALFCSIVATAAESGNPAEETPAQICLKSISEIRDRIGTTDDEIRSGKLMPMLKWAGDSFGTLSSSLRRFEGQMRRSPREVIIDTRETANTMGMLAGGAESGATFVKGATLTTVLVALKITTAEMACRRALEAIR